ncbi:MAG: NUDIX domain-containing protein [Methanomassiliicoccales archaeon]|nr:MAG: NUDIX domain-containing protein [Methanomassiliicoccales archaeon]
MKEKQKKEVEYRHHMKFEVIARAIIIVNQEVLLQRNVERDEFALPGGHIEEGETMKQSLVRELKEETNLEIDVGKLVYVNENFFEQEGQEFHEIGLYFLADIIGEPPSKLESQESHIDFWFIGLDGLAQIDLYPSFLRTVLPEDAKSIFSDIEKHIVQKGDEFRIE